jgi:hypothetical protein
MTFGCAHYAADAAPGGAQSDSELALVLGTFDPKTCHEKSPIAPRWHIETPRNSRRAPALKIQVS